MHFLNLCYKHAKKKNQETRKQGSSKIAVLRLLNMSSKIYRTMNPTEGEYSVTPKDQV